MAASVEPRVRRASVQYLKSPGPPQEDALAQRVGLRRSPRSSERPGAAIKRRTRRGGSGTCRDGEHDHRRGHEPLSAEAGSPRLKAASGLDPVQPAALEAPVAKPTAPSPEEAAAEYRSTRADGPVPAVRPTGHVGQLVKPSAPCAHELAGVGRVQWLLASHAVARAAPENG